MTGIVSEGFVGALSHTYYLITCSKHKTQKLCLFQYHLLKRKQDHLNSKYNNNTNTISN